MKTLKQRNSTPVAKPMQQGDGLLDKLSFTHCASGGVSVMVNLEQVSNVAVNVYDIKGDLVAPLYSSSQARGNLSINWNGMNNRGMKVAHGSYIMAVSTNGKTVSKQFALVR
jgi:flagellar hook assembly protein FlgD